MKTILATAALSLALAGAASAADDQGRYQVLGLGALTCADYIDAPAEAADIVGVWVQGYATALNQVVAGVKDVTAGHSDAEIAQSLWNVCKANPKLMMAARSTREAEHEFIDVFPDASAAAPARWWQR